MTGISAYKRGTGGEIAGSMVNDNSSIAIGGGRDTKMSYRDAQLLNPDSRFYK
jgi:hypothetical protein